MSEVLPDNAPQEPVGDILRRIEQELRAQGEMLRRLLSARSECGIDPMTPIGPLPPKMRSEPQTEEIAHEIERWSKNRMGSSPETDPEPVDAKRIVHGTAGR